MDLRESQMDPELRAGLVSYLFPQARGLAHPSSPRQRRRHPPPPLLLPHQMAMCLLLIKQPTLPQPTNRLHVSVTNLLDFTCSRSHG